jgi:hypothetical protein
MALDDIDGLQAAETRTEVGPDGRIGSRAGVLLVGTVKITL